MTSPTTARIPGGRPKTATIRAAEKRIRAFRAMKKRAPREDFVAPRITMEVDLLPALYEFARQHGSWIGTAKELLTALTVHGAWPLLPEGAEPPDWRTDFDRLHAKINAGASHPNYIAFIGQDDRIRLALSVPPFAPVPTGSQFSVPSDMCGYCGISERRVEGRNNRFTGGEPVHRNDNGRRIFYAHPQCKLAFMRREGTLPGIGKALPMPTSPVAQVQVVSSKRQVREAKASVFLALVRNGMSLERAYNASGFPKRTAHDWKAARPEWASQLAASLEAGKIHRAQGDEGGEQ